MASKQWLNTVAKILQDNIKATEDFNQKYTKKYNETLRKIEKDIAYWLSRVETDGNLDIKKLKESLSREEKQALYMSLEDYTNRIDGEVDTSVTKLIRDAYYLKSLDRLQAVSYEIRKHLEALYYQLEEEVHAFIGETYLSNYYKATFESMKYEGYRPFRKVNHRKLEKIINTPWLENGSNFSDSIWKDKRKLLNELEDGLVDMAKKGTPVKDVSKQLAERMRVAENKAKTVIRTENAYFSNEAMSEAFQEGTSDSYEIVATLDLKTSNICRRMDGKVFKWKDKKVGINHPHFHPNCRTTVAPYYGDDIEKALDDTRMARDPITGKSVLVKKMDYEEWHKRFVESDLQAVIAEKRIKNRYNDKKQFNKYKGRLGKDAPRSFDGFQKMKYEDSKAWEELKKKYKTN